MANEHRILEEHRRAAVVSASNVLRASAAAKRARRRAEGSSRPERRAGDERADRRQDFLVDFLRLQSSYLNAMAKLGHEHVDLAHRALENFYALMRPGGSAPEVSELVFDGETVERQFAVECRKDRRATARITWTDLRGPRPSAPLPDALRVEAPGGAVSTRERRPGLRSPRVARADRAITVELSPGKPVLVTVSLNRKSLGGRIGPFESEVHVDVGGSERLVTVRVPQERK
jgi:hypothetical protein